MAVNKNGVIIRTVLSDNEIFGQSVINAKCVKIHAYGIAIKKNHSSNGKLKRY